MMEELVDMVEWQWDRKRAMTVTGAGRCHCCRVDVTVTSAELGYCSGAVICLHVERFWSAFVAHALS